VDTDTLIIGAGPAGLAVGACLMRCGVEALILEQSDAVGARWRAHYDRLHLHTDRRHSALPYLGFAPGTPRFPSRAQLLAYLERYATHFRLQPRFGEEVSNVRREGIEWVATTATQRYRARHVVMATGLNAIAKRPHWTGEERFGGRILHSSEYRDGRAFHGQRVLVVGIGNSGAEIALDLHEHGASVALSVRGAVNVVPREMFGLPLLTLSIPLSLLPARLADAIAAPLIRVTVGDVRRLGLRKASLGPLTQIARESRVPLIDIGTLQLLRERRAELLGAIANCTSARSRSSMAPGAPSMRSSRRPAFGRDSSVCWQRPTRKHIRARDCIGVASPYPRAACSGTSDARRCGLRRRSRRAE
jgi:indole-3-pyruvate monooxygenase